MTMIFTCLTQDFVIQASDRRISKVIDKKVQWYDDQSNKALVYKSQFVFAYTGQATIPVRKNGQTIDISTIDWAAEQLTKGKKLDEAVNNLKFRVTELMNSMILECSVTHFILVLLRYTLPGTSLKRI